MKRILVAMLLVAAVTAVAQTAAAPAQSAPPQSAAPAAQTPAATPAPAPQKKEIKDPAEYNAYMGALGQQDAAAKISGLEAFLTQYPNSVMKEDALELLMGSYQQTGNSAKTLETAQKVLQANPCNLRALALLAYTKQAMAQQGGAAAGQNLTEAGQYADKGLDCEQTAVKPDGTSPEDFQKLKTQTAVIFNGASGVAAYQLKDYAKAQQRLRAAVDADPKNLVNVYTLARAYLEPGPTEKDVDGLFYIARSANLAQGSGKDQIAKYGKSKYTKYHGSDEGWNDLMAKAATATDPTGITITQYVPPTPAQQAHDIMASKKVEEMSFAEWQLVLSEGTPEDAEKVWTTLKGKPLQMVAHLLTIDTTGKLTKMTLAGSSDDVDAKRADIDLTMAAALPKKDVPKEDTDFQFEGTPVSYVAKPFVMTMNEGALLVKAAPKPPVHKKPAAH
jgi:tetratricopeptide (TPR) repeat protein